MAFIDPDTPDTPDQKRGFIDPDDYLTQGQETYKDPIPSPFKMAGNVLAGAVRGAGSIGSTLIRPFESAEENAARRKAIDEGLALLGADPESMSYGAGKIGGEIAGTAGAGGAIANAMRGIPQIARFAPAIESWGFGAPTVAQRAIGGAIPGAAAAGMVDPEHIGTGAAVGAITPFAAPAIGKMSNFLIEKGQQLAGGAQGQAIEYLRKAFPDNWQEVAQRLKDLKQYIPMEKPTIAAAAPEFSGKLSALEQRARSSTEMADDFVRRDAANQLARREAAQRQAERLGGATQGRTDVTKPLYAEAEAAQVPIDDTLRTIMQGPEVNKALNAMTDTMRQGQVNSAVAGRSVQPTIVSRRAAPETDYVNDWGVPIGATPEKIQIQAVENWKKAIDAELNAFNKNAPSPLGLGNINAEQLKTARNQLTQWINQASPKMAEARAEFAARSPQVNQAQFFGDVADALDKPLTAEGMAQLNTMIKDLPKAFTRSTGIARYQTPEEVLGAMSPLGRRTLEGIYQSGQREVAGARASTGIGSLPEIGGVLSRLEHGTPGMLSSVVMALRGTLKRLGANTDEAAMEIINRATIDPNTFARLIESTPPTERSAVMNAIRKLAASNQVGAVVVAPSAVAGAEMP